jgi:hypothetical protein
MAIFALRPAKRPAEGASVQAYRRTRRAPSASTRRPTTVSRSRGVGRIFLNPPYSPILLVPVRSDAADSPADLPLSFCYW